MIEQPFVISHMLFYTKQNKHILESLPAALQQSRLGLVKKNIILGGYFGLSRSLVVLRLVVPLRQKQIQKETSVLNR